MWRKASQAAVKATLREGEGDAALFVSRLPLVRDARLDSLAPEPWITDPSGLIRCEPHHYWDCDHSGTLVTRSNERNYVRG
jgi:hypothetical protein